MPSPSPPLGYNASMPTDAANLASEGDVNQSPLRRAWEAKHVGIATRALLDADSEHFLHQSLSTPCFDALKSCDGICSRMSRAVASWTSMATTFIRSAIATRA